MCVREYLVVRPLYVAVHWLALFWCQYSGFSSYIHYHTSLLNLSLTICRLEHGTVPFLGILALRHGFNAVKRIAQSMFLVSQHTFLLAQMVYKELNQLKHCNSQPVCVLYHNGHFDDIATQGGIVNFNILDSDGEFVGYSQVSLGHCIRT